MATQILDERSLPSAKSEQELFTLPPTQVEIDYGFWEVINPENPVTNEGPYTFIVHLICSGTATIYTLNLEL